MAVARLHVACMPEGAAQMHGVDGMWSYDRQRRHTEEETVSASGRYQSHFDRHLSGKVVPGDTGDRVRRSGCGVETDE